MKFENFAVLGTGTLALFCASALQEQGCPVTLYEMAPEPSGFLERRAQGAGLAYVHREKKALFRELANAAQPTLLISAINPYILPEYLLANPMITAINCHQALLPHHPGRNAEMWAIYEGDQKTGITWHLLTEEVDGGDILIQKELELQETHTAYRVFKEQIELAQQGFETLLPQLLSGELTGRPQEKTEERRLHYAKDVPNDGWLEPAWEAEQISRFLRAMDYSILQVVPRPRIQVNGREAELKKYKIVREQRYDDGIYEEDQTIFLQKPETLFILTRL